MADDWDHYNEGYSDGYAAGRHEAQEESGEYLESPNRIEEVAIALFHHRSPLASWDDAPEWRCERYLEMAKVAVDAIRED